MSDASDGRLPSHRCGNCRRDIENSTPMFVDVMEHVRSSDPSALTPLPGQYGPPCTNVHQDPVSTPSLIGNAFEGSALQVVRGRIADVTGAFPLLELQACSLSEGRFDLHDSGRSIFA